MAAKALQSLAGGTALTDITLQANATYFPGPDEQTGPATLVALGNQMSLMTLNLTSGQLQETRNGPAGAWVGTDGTAHAMATHNCFVDASWFFPAFSLSALASDPMLVIVLVGQEVHAGQPVYHLSFLRNITGQTSDIIALVQRLSVMDLYLAIPSLLPVALDFNTHADNDVNTSFAVEIRFAGYQAFNGVLVPTRIQKYFQDSLLFDFTIINAALNSGVPVSTFALPTVATGGAQ